MSMYADYLREKTKDEILETPQGFGTYRTYYDQKDGCQAVYIIDLFVLPDFRKTGAASSIADTIVEEARRKGCKKLLGSVVPSNNDSTSSVKVLLAYGMTLESSTDNFILFRKDI